MEKLPKPCMLVKIGSFFAKRYRLKAVLSFLVFPIIFASIANANFKYYLKLINYYDRHKSDQQYDDEIELIKETLPRLSKQIDKCDSQAIEDAQKYFQQEKDRLKSIEDKAKIGLIGISISLTIILSSISLDGELRDLINHSPVSYVIYFLLVYSVCHLLLAGHSSLKALEIGEYYSEQIDERIKGNYFTDQKKERLNALYSYIIKNQYLTNQRSNFVVASYHGILIGITLFAFTFLLILPIQMSANSSKNSQIKNLAIEDLTIKRIRNLSFNNGKNSIIRDKVPASYSKDSQTAAINKRFHPTLQKKVTP